MKRLTPLFLATIGCGGSATAPVEPAPSTTAPTPTEPWPVRDGWRSETIPFPLEFAPTLAHRGVEELRFGPGFFDPAAPGYFSYAFVWRTDDPAQLDAAALGGELTAYFRGLIDAVDQNKRITARDEIVATAQPIGPDSFAIDATIYDAFKTGERLQLTGTAVRRACGTGALWIFELSPPTSGLRQELKAVVEEAACGQPEPAKPGKPGP
ncbi:MAG: hypothetical protein AB7P03_13475 [Kofleriaceae bacterium]